jgi:hypothetical protein
LAAYRAVGSGQKRPCVRQVRGASRTT